MLVEFAVNAGEVRLTPKRILANNLKVKSRKTSSQLAVNSHKRNTIYDLNCGILQLDGNVIEDFEKSKKLLANKLTLTEAKAVIYTDMNADVQQMPKKILSQLFKELELPVDIREVELRTSYIRYDLRAKRRIDNGSIYVSNVNGTLKNVTNIPSVLQDDVMIRSQLTGQLMGKGRLDMSMNFNMIDDQNSYDYKSRLVGLDFNDVNRMLEDLTAVRIKKGLFDEMEIDVKSNKYRSQGTLEFYYRNLKLEYVEERTTGIPDPIRLFVNRLILRQNNRRDRSPKIGKVDVKHDPTHSTFKRVWESVFDGLQKTLLPKNPLRK